RRSCLRIHLSVLFLSIRLPRPTTLFPYTTLFRSRPPCPGMIEPKSLVRKCRLIHDSNRSPPCDSTPTAAPARASRSGRRPPSTRSEEHTSELQSRENLVCRLLLEKKNMNGTLTAP